MAIETQHTESLEDIVFKNRNKEYGSYFLRKNYRKYVIISMIFGFVLIGAVVAYPLINAYINKERLIREKEKEVGVKFENLKQEEAPPPPPPPPPPEAMVEKVKFTAPVVVEDTTIEVSMANMDDLNKKVAEAPTEDVEVEMKENLFILLMRLLRE